MSKPTLAEIGVPDAHSSTGKLHFRTVMEASSTQLASRHEHRTVSTAPGHSGLSMCSKGQCARCSDHSYLIYSDEREILWLYCPHVVRNGTWRVSRNNCFRRLCSRPSRSLRSVEQMQSYVDKRDVCAELEASALDAQISLLPPS